MGKLYFIFLALQMTFISFSMNAQLKLQGHVLSDGPVEITYHHASDGNTYVLPLYKSKVSSEKDHEVFQTRFKLPYGFEKNYDYVLKFTDGTVDKMLIVHGPVPEGIWPKQKIDLEIWLTDQENVEETLVIYWSILRDEYIARPYSELDKINTEAHRPLMGEWIDEFTAGQIDHVR